MCQIFGIWHIYHTSSVDALSQPLAPPSPLLKYLTCITQFVPTFLQYFYVMHSVTLNHKIYKIVEPEDNRGESLHLNEKWDESHMGLEHFVAGDTSSLQSSLFWITQVHIGHQIWIFIFEEKRSFCISITISQPLSIPSTSTEVFNIHHTIPSLISTILYVMDSVNLNLYIKSVEPSYGRAMLGLTFLSIS